MITLEAGRVFAHIYLKKREVKSTGVGPLLLVIEMQLFDIYYYCV